MKGLIQRFGFVGAMACGAAYFFSGQQVLWLVLGGALLLTLAVINWTEMSEWDRAARARKLREDQERVQELEFEEKRAERRRQEAKQKRETERIARERALEAKTDRLADEVRRNEMHIDQLREREVELSTEMNRERYQRDQREAELQAKITELRKLVDPGDTPGGSPDSATEVDPTTGPGNR